MSTPARRRGKKAVTGKKAVSGKDKGAFSGKVEAYGPYVPAVAAVVNLISELVRVLF
ncbi:hypothetical protein [Actinoplanes xinjiangensis]|uniref:hypothetical protein n=1 Tax=Actinoplanes xinjiangensis TaxID=512350 RepID=UPI003448BACA